MAGAHRKASAARRSRSISMHAGRRAGSSERAGRGGDEPPGTAAPLDAAIAVDVAHTTRTAMRMPQATAFYLLPSFEGGRHPMVNSPYFRY